MLIATHGNSTDKPFHRQARSRARAREAKAIAAVHRPEYANSRLQTRSRALVKHVCYVTWQFNSARRTIRSTLNSIRIAFAPVVFVETQQRARSFLHANTCKHATLFSLGNALPRCGGEFPRSCASTPLIQRENERLPRRARSQIQPSRKLDREYNIHLF